MTSPLKLSPFHPRTSVLNLAQNWRRWAGYLASSAYELQHDREYAAIRNSAALLDITPLYKYLVAGPDAGRLLQRVVTRDVSRCRVGQVMYTPWCTAAGKIIDDGTLARLGEDRFRLTSAEPNLRWLCRNAMGLDVSVTDVSDRTAALALQGPLSREILRECCEADISGLGFFRLTAGTIRGMPVTVSRTGYTGDLGYEIWADAAQALPLWDAVMDAGSKFGITPAGMLALDVARIEAGLILLDVDYVPATKAVIERQLSTPYELGLGWTVKLDKGDFNGRAALAREHAAGPSWNLVGLEMDWESLERQFAAVGLPPRLQPAAWRTSVPVYLDERQVGYATSGCWSPLLKKSLALAHLEAGACRPGLPLTMEVTVEHRRRRAAVRVAKTPFFDPKRKRD